MGGKMRRKATALLLFGWMCTPAAAAAPCRVTQVLFHDADTDGLAIRLKQSTLVRKFRPTGGVGQIAWNCDGKFEASLVRESRVYPDLTLATEDSNLSLGPGPRPLFGGRVTLVIATVDGRRSNNE